MTGISVEIVEDSGGTDKLTKTVSKLRDAVEKAADSADKSQAATKRYGNTAATAANQTNLLSRAAGGAQTGFGLLSTALGGIAAYLGGSKLIKYADTYTEIGNRLRLVTKDQLATNAAIDASFSIAQKTRSGFEEVAGVYGRVNEALKNVNGTSATAASITTTVAQAVALSGASAESAKNALTQFQQGLASGTLRGDEFNSVMENTPGLARALAEGLGIPIGRLRSMAEAGELTSARIVAALDKAAPKVAAAFAQTAPTVAQAYTVLENSVIRYIGQTNSAYSVTGMIANAIIGLGNNMNIVAPILATLVAGLAAIAAVSIISTIYGMVSGFIALAGAAGAAALAVGTTFLIPLAAIGAAALVATGVLYALGYSFKDVTTFLSALLSTIPGYNELAAKVKDATTTWTKSNEGLNKSFGDMKDSLGGAQKAGNGWADQVEKMNKNTNAYGEDLDKADDNTKKLGKSTNTTGAYVQQFVRTTQDGSGWLKNYGGAVSSAATATDQLGESSADAMRQLQELYTATSAIVGTADLLERYGNVGQGAFDKIAGAANRASSSVSTATDNMRNDAAAGFSVNGQLTRNDPVAGGGEAGPASYNISRNGAVVDTITPIALNEVRGSTYDPGSVALYRSQLSEGIVAAFDKYKPGASNAEVSAAIRAVQAATYTSSMADANTGRMNLGNTQKALADFERNLASSVSKSTGSSSVAAFATGGQFIVRGDPGTDTNVVPIRATRGERVTVETPQQQRETDREVPTSGRAGPITVNVYAKDADSFARSEKQMLQDFAAQLARAI